MSFISLAAAVNPLAVGKPGPLAYVYLTNVIFDAIACPDMSFLKSDLFNVALQAYRPKEVPGNQDVRFLDGPVCNPVPTNPAMTRQCLWNESNAFRIADMAAYGAAQDTITGLAVLAGYVVHITHAVYGCRIFIDEACTTAYGQNGCFRHIVEEYLQKQQQQQQQQLSLLQSAHKESNNRAAIIVPAVIVPISAISGAHAYLHVVPVPFHTTWCTVKHVPQYTFEDNIMQFNFPCSGRCAGGVDIPKAQRQVRLAPLQSIFLRDLAWPCGVDDHTS